MLKKYTLFSALLFHISLQPYPVIEKIPEVVEEVVVKETTKPKTAIKKNISIDFENNKCTVIYYSQNQMSTATFDLSSLLKTLNQDQLAAVNEGNIESLLNAIPESAEHYLKKASNKNNIEEVKKIEKSTLKDWINQSSDFRKHLKNISAQNANLNEQLYEEQIRSLLNDLPARTMYENQMREFTDQFNDFFDIPSTEKLFSFVQFQFNVPTNNHLIQSFINSRNIQFNSALNDIYYNMVVVGDDRKIKSINHVSANGRYAIACKVGSFIADSIPWKKEQFFKQLSKNSHDFQHYVNSRKKWWQFEPIQLLYTVVSFVSRPFFYSRNNIEALSHYQHLVQIYSLYKSGQIQKAQSITDKYNKTEQSLLEACKRKFPYSPITSSVSTPRFSGLVVQEHALTEQATQLLRYYHVRPQFNVDSYEQQLVVEKFITVANKLANCIFTTHNDTARMTYIGALDSLIMAIEYYKENKADQLAFLFNELHDLSSKQAQIRQERINRVFKSVCQELHHTVTHPKEFVLDAITGITHIALWFIDAAMVSIAGTPKEFENWMIANLEMVDNFIDQFEHLTDEEVDQMEGKVIANFLSGYFVGKIPIVIKRIPLPPTGTFGKLSQFFFENLKKATDFINKHNPLKSEPVVTTPEGILLQATDFNIKRGKPKSPFKNITHVKKFISLNKEIEQLKLEFDGIRTLSGPLKGKKLTFELSHFLQPGMTQSGFRTGWHYDPLGVFERIRKFNGKNIEIYSKTKGTFGTYQIKWGFEGQPSKKSSFFPKHWDSRTVIKKILEAYDSIEDKTVFKKSKSGNWELIGKTKEKIPVRLIFNENGKLITAFPDLDL